MDHVLRYVLVTLGLFTAAAQATDHQKLTVGGLHTRYSGEYGSREIINAEYASVLGANTYVVNLAHGERDFNDAANSSFDDQSMSGTFYRHWSPLFLTRSSVTASTNSPVFARRIFDQDVTYKGIPQATLTAGAKHAEYYGGVRSNAWYVSGAYYFDRVTTRARFTRYDLSGLGDTFGASLMVQLNDAAGGGASQLWLGTGTSLQEYVWLADTMAGRAKTVAVRRIQPLGQKLSMAASIERAWYDTQVNDYNGLTGQLSVSYKW